MPTKLVAWDIDRVWYPDISTTYAARGNKHDYRPYLTRVVEELKSASYEQIKLWETATRREIASVGDIADMLTDLFYGLKRDDEVLVPKGTITKDQIIAGKQSLLKDMTIGDIKAIADGVPETKGLRYAFDLAHDKAHVGFSDGLGPFVAYKMARIRVSIGGIVPSIVDNNGREEVFDESTAKSMISSGTPRLTGRVLPFKKADSIKAYVFDRGYNLSDIAAIDDSSANVPFLAEVKNSGGLSIGFNVNDLSSFKEAGIPVLKGDDLSYFGEILRDPRKIKEYCETWGLIYDAATI